MANMLYNGVELPDIESVWTDKETYPYAYICDATDEGLPYGLVISTVQGSVNANGNVEFGMGGEYAVVVYVLMSATDVSWTYVTEGAANDSFAAWEMYTKERSIWANHDILNSDGTVYLAASDPVSAGGSKLTLSVGGGNGDVHEVYFDVTTTVAYSSALGAYVSAELLNEPGPSVGDTVYVSFNGVMYRDIVTTAAAFGNAPVFGDLTLATRPYVIGYFDVNGDGTLGWFLATGTSGSHTLKAFKINDAQSAVTWDGDTTGLSTTTLYGGTVYKVSDRVFTEAELAGATLFLANGTELNEDNGLSWRVGTNVAIATSGVNLVLTTNAGGSITSNVHGTETFEEAGTYFTANQTLGIETRVLILPNAVSSVTDTTATVSFTCTNLVSAETVYQICLYICAQGGTYTEPVATHRTGLFGGPSFSGSYTFTGLAPETAYEVYAVLHEGGTETDVGSLAAFTTLEATASGEEPFSSPAYIGDADGIARQLECIYIGGADGIARKVLRAYVGSESGLAVLWWGGAAENA